MNKKILSDAFGWVCFFLLTTFYIYSCFEKEPVTDKLWTESQKYQLYSNIYDQLMIKNKDIEERFIKKAANGLCNDLQMDFNAVDLMRTDNGKLQEYAKFYEEVGICYGNPKEPECDVVDLYTKGLKLNIKLSQ